jgi:hypothetical protein
MNINGKKYIKHVLPAGFTSKWYATIEVRRLHQYSKRTAYGERKRWKFSHLINLGDFPSRDAALLAAKNYIEKLKENKK